MKRSEINTIMREAIAFIRDRQFALPPFAYWTPAQWETLTEDSREIVEAGLGWDITDFGSGDFDRVGLFLFTLRNGVPGSSSVPMFKSYAEKIMIVRENQLTPTHFHHSKMEDIINRGGGNLLIDVWNAAADDGLADTDVRLSLDGTCRTIAAGSRLSLQPGASVCLPPRLYHCFRGEPETGPVLVGEVSRVNDDHTDNRFLDPVGRFPDIVEDEAPLYLLSCDYGRYYRPKEAVNS